MRQRILKALSELRKMKLINTFSAFLIVSTQQKRHKKTTLYSMVFFSNVLFILYFPKIYLSVNCACQTSKAEAFFWKESLIKVLVPAASV
jgi:hypothetical protein